MKNMLYLLLLVLFASVALADDQSIKGHWKTIDFEAAGNWQLSQEDGRWVVQLSEDFVTKNGPDLHVLLSTKALSEVNNNNANQTSIQAGLLKTDDSSTFFKKMKGAQRFVLPADFNINAYRSILIHCVQYSHLWAGSDLPKLSSK